MEDGSRIFFWSDPWPLSGPLVDVLGEDFIAKVRSAPNIMVKEFYECNI